jgi:hypothetical protein
MNSSLIDQILVLLVPDHHVMFVLSASPTARHNDFELIKPSIHDNLCICIFSEQVVSIPDKMGFFASMIIA